MFFLAKRFVAGSTRDEAIARARVARNLNLLVTIDHLGEHIKDASIAKAVTQEYIELLQAILNSNHNSSSDPSRTQGEGINISVKPTHLGLDISYEEALGNLKKIIHAAKSFGNFVRLDMESSFYTESTLKLANVLHDELGGHVGVVMQAYLHRSYDDIEDLIAKKIRVRLCKGAYKESPAIVFNGRAEINANYDKLCQRLIECGNYPAIATHDEERIRNAISYARQYGRSPKDFEFQMLLGMREQLAKDLIKSGFNVRIYLPYGKDWLSYYYRRLRERKENIYFLLNNLFKN